MVVQQRSLFYIPSTCPSNDGLGIDRKEP